MRLGSRGGQSTRGRSSGEPTADPIKAASQPFVNTGLVHLGEKFDQR
jgi:hypothetical protein